MQQVAKKSKKSYILLLLRISLAIAAVWWFLKGKDLGQIASAFSQIKISVLITAVALFILSQFIFVLRWRLILKVQKIDISIFAGVKLHFLGLFYNNFLPSSVGGDLLRAWYVTSHTEKKFAAALSVFVDRIIGLVGMIIMAVFCYLLIPVDESLGKMNMTMKGDSLYITPQQIRLITMILLGIVAAMLVLLSVKRSRNFMKSLYLRIMSHASEILRKLRAAGGLYFSKPLAILFAFFLTFICQSLFILACILIGNDLGIIANPKYYFVFMPISWLIGAIPISIGGLGFMEKGIEFMFTSIGATAGSAATLAIAQRFILVVSSMPGLAVHLLGGHLPKGKISIDYPEPIN